MLPASPASYSGLAGAPHTDGQRFPHDPTRAGRRLPVDRPHWVPRNKDEMDAVGYTNRIVVRGRVDELPRIEED